MVIGMAGNKKVGKMLDGFHSLYYPFAYKAGKALPASSSASTAPPTLPTPPRLPRPLHLLLPLLLEHAHGQEMTFRQDCLPAGGIPLTLSPQKCRSKRW